MATPYQSTGSASGGLLRRRASVTLEGIEDLFARVECIREVTPSMVAQLCEERRIDLRNRLSRGRRDLYRRYLKHCLDDRVLSEEERADLAHLQSLLHLSHEDLAAIHDEVAIEVYGEAVQEVLEDFRLDDDEALFLQQLRDGLGMRPEQAERILQDESSSAHHRAMRRAESRDRQFIEHRTPAGEFTGRSEGTLESAIEDALSAATLAIPDLHWFEITQIAGYVGTGKAESWHVTLRAGLRQVG